MNIQRKLELIGKEGCYLLCLWELGGRLTGFHKDIVQFYDFCLSQKWIEVDCLVLEPGKILGWLVEGNYTYRKEYDLNYKPRLNELVIERWEWVTTGTTKAHFVLPDWDPYDGSQTKANGKKVSLRVLSRTE